MCDTEGLLTSKGTATPPGITYGTPFIAPDDSVFDSPRQFLPEQEMPFIVIWVLGAFRSLEYRELGIACTIMDASPLWPNFQIPSQEEISARSLDVIQFDSSGAVTHSSGAADILTTFVPTEDADRLILDTLLKGMTRKEYLGSHFERPLASSRFGNLTPADLQGHVWCGFMQYATFYWPTHLRRIREPLSLEMEAALNLLLTPPICLTWIEALAIFTGQSFHTSLGRALGLVADFCNIGGALVTPETLESLRRWIKSGHELLSGHANILERFPSEIHHIQPHFLSDDSSFRREPLEGVQWAIPACAPLKRLPKESIFDDAARSTGYDGMHCILDEPKNRMYVTSQSRTRYTSSWFGGREDKRDLRSWSIGCFALDTGVEIARFRGRTPFEVVGSSWRGYGTVTVQLTLTNDSGYLAYEEHLEPDQSTQKYAFTYYWRLRDFAAVDDDYFGPCTMINRGVPFSSSMRSIETLRFFPDNTTLQHLDGRYDVENQKSVDSSGPFTKHGPFAKYGDVLSAQASPDGSALSIIRSMDGGRRLLQVWSLTGDGFSMTLSRIFKTTTLQILGVSPSGRFVTFTHGASTSETESRSLPESDHDTESESENNSDSFSGPKKLHSCRVLDTQNGNEHELFSYRDDTWNARDDHVTPLRPDRAFFGQLEPDASLLIVRPTSGLNHPEGRIWRRSQSGWTNVGHIGFDWACAALKFTSDDSRILGVRGDGLFSVRADSLRERVVAIDIAAVRQESERQRSCWADSSLFYLNSEMPSGVAHKVRYIID